MMDTKTVNKPALAIAGGGTRISYIDALKGFAILCVVFGHIVGGYLDAGVFSERKIFLHNAQNAVYMFHMPLFMMISGFVYCKAYCSDGMPNRSRIYVQSANQFCVYIVFSTAFLLMRMLSARYVNNAASLIDILLLPIKPVAPYWYLYVLIGFYIAFSLISIDGPSQGYLLAVTIIFTGLGSLVNTPFFSIGGLLYYSFFFYLGICNAKRNSFFTSVQFVISSVLVALIFLLIFWSQERFINAIPGVSQIVALGMSVGIWCCFEHFHALEKIKLFQLCGKYCLEIYVIHCVLTAGNRTILLKLGMTELYLNILVNFVISTSLPIVFAKVCECLQIHDLVFKPISFIARKRN